MNGKGEVSIVDSSSNTHIKGSPFKVQILSSQINDENLTSLLNAFPSNNYQLLIDLQAFQL